MRSLARAVQALLVICVTGCNAPQPMPVTPEITTESLDDGVVGSPYSGQLHAHGGTGPYTWSLEKVPGELGWLTVDSKTGALSGTPGTKVPDAFSFDARVTDSKARTSTRGLDLVVKGCTPGAEIACHHAESGQCRQNTLTCSLEGNIGTCSGGEPFNDMDHCGSGSGTACGICSPAVANHCSDDTCMCGTEAACSSGRICRDGQCIYECGNGTVDPGEQCDEGTANSDTGACLPTCKLNVCGDGYVRAGAEACDTGPESATAKNECPYGLGSCTLCSVCQLVTLTGPYCGDGVVQSAHGEQCDHEASFACGTCGRPYTSDACKVIDRQQSRGSLTVASTALQGVTFELSDGETSRTFEFIDSGGSPQPSNLPVVIGAAPADVAASIAGQVSANLEIDAAASGETVNLTNRAKGIFGNKPIVISPDDAQALTATGMDEGTGCSLGQRCNANADCVGTKGCSNYQHVCQ